MYQPMIKQTPCSTTTTSPPTLLQRNRHNEQVRKKKENKNSETDILSAKVAPSNGPSSYVSAIRYKVF